MIITRQRLVKLERLAKELSKKDLPAGFFIISPNNYRSKEAMQKDIKKRQKDLKTKYKHERETPFLILDL